MKTIATILFLFFVTTTFSQDSVVEYYNEISTGSEYGRTNQKTVKWYTDVKIYFDFTNSDSLKTLVTPILNELNDIIIPINIIITNKKEESNSIIYLGKFQDFKSKYKIIGDGKFLGFAAVFNYGKAIHKSFIFINEKISGNELKSVLREEITQSLGLLNDSWKYPESIFYQGGYNGCKFSDLDKEVIKLHYNH